MKWGFEIKYLYISYSFYIQKLQVTTNTWLIKEIHSFTLVTAKQSYINQYKQCDALTIISNSYYVGKPTISSTCIPYL